MTMLTHQNPSPQRPTRTVIIGARGFVGGAIAERLAQDHVPVLGLTRRDIDLLAQDAWKKLADVLRPDDAVVFVSAVAPARNPKDPQSWGKVGRNEACPCGSGKKFKHCHGKYQ